MEMNNMISNPADRKKIRDALQEISNSFTRIEAERDLIKDIKNDLVEEFQLPKKTLNKMAKTFHKQNIDVEQAEFDQLMELYEEVTKG